MSALAQRLQSTTPCGALTADELDAVLLWLSGRVHDAHPDLAAALGPVETQPELRWQVFQQLHAVLFAQGDQGQLNTHGAHVHRGLDEATRRTRFRRLAAAFHTDRYSDPALIEWLTPRAQAIGLAYSAFRQGDKPIDGNAPTPANIDDWLKDIDGRSSAELRPRSAPSWMRRLGRIHNLHIKVPAALAVIVLLPLFALLLLTPNQRPIEQASEQAGEQAPQLTQTVETAPTLAPSPAVAEPEPLMRPMAEPAVQVAERADTASPIEPERTPEPKSELEPALAATPPLDEPHQVEPGETLFSIAQQRNMTWHTLADINLIDQPELLETGQLLWFQSLLPLALSFESRSEQRPEPVAVFQAEAQPEPEPEHSEPAVAMDLAQPIEHDPLTVVERAHAAIEAAELRGFLATLSDAPRENQQQGRDWFRVSYGTLFQSSTRRQIVFQPLSVNGQAPRWQIMGQLQLTVDFAEHEPVELSRITRYVVIQDDGGELRIASIDY